MRPTLKAVRSSPSPFPFAQRFFHSSKYLRFTKSTPTLSKQAAEAASKAAVSDGSSFCVVAFLKKVGTLYATYLGANYISNALIHPTQKIDYGILNQFFPDGRAMDSPFWGTRLPHLILIPTTLTFYDIVVGHISTNYFGLVSFAKTPKVWLLHLYVYTFLAVGTFFAIDSFFNPYLENKRMDNFTSLLHPLTIGMSLQWHAQIMNDMFMVSI